MPRSRDSEIDALPLTADDKRRIKMTLSCPDAAALPRVRRAGRIVEGKQGRYQLMHNGIKVIADGYIGPWVTELIRLLKGLHEPQEEKAFSEVLEYMPDGATMVELGSWWAYYSLWFQKAVKNARNYMIEPDPNNLEVGMRNFALNGMTGYHLNAAVGRESAASIMYRCYESDNLERPIPVISVDDLIAREAIESVDLLLSDIQGVELDMLRGAEKSISEGRIRFVVLSTHHHTISNDPLMHQKCLAFLREHQANILAEHTITESYSGDGLIVASLRPDDADLPPIEVSRNAARASLFGEPEYDLAAAFDERSHWKAEFESKQAELVARTAEYVSKAEEAATLQGELNAKETQLKETREALETQNQFYDHAAEEQRQFYEDALQKAEEEHQRLDGLLNARDQLVQGLQSMVSGLEAEQQLLQDKLDAAHSEAASALTALEQEFQARLSAVEQQAEATRLAVVQQAEAAQRAMEQEFEVSRQEFESARHVLQRELDANRQYVTLLESHVDSLEGEVSGLRVVVKEMRSSISWRLSAPIRWLRIREVARRLALSVYRLLRRGSGTSKVLSNIQRESPELWQAVATGVKSPQAQGGTSAMPAGGQLSAASEARPSTAEAVVASVPNDGTAAVTIPEQRPVPRLVVRVDLDSRQHFLELFQRELARRERSQDGLQP